jgi:hypothetical protein
MIVGLNFLENASRRLRESKESLKTQENFEDVNAKKLSAMEGAETGILFVIYMIAVAFFILELLLVFYAVTIAMKSSTPGMNRIAHVSLAVFFTFPYLLFNLVLNKTTL